LRGAERILRDNFDIKILMEYWPYGLEKALVSPHELIAYIESFGFEIVTMPGESYDVGNFKSSAAADRAEFRNLILFRTPPA